MNVCTMPGCQTTAGCICDRVSSRPIYHCGAPERQVVYAWAGEVDELRTEVNRLRVVLAALYEWYDRDGSVGGADLAFEAHRHALSAADRGAKS